jgi:hypothetical protein
VAGIFVKLALCGYTLRVTSQTSYSPDYITPTQKKITLYCIYTTSIKPLSNKPPLYNNSDFSFMTKKLTFCIDSIHASGNYVISASSL